MLFEFYIGMHKTIIQIGLLIFFLAVFFFTRMGMPIQDILLRSLVLFLAATILLSIIILIFYKSINKMSSNSDEDFSDNLDRK